MGQRLISLKGDVGWGGKTTQAVNDRGQRRWLKIENGYVSGDGSEIRHFPGFVTLLDLTEVNNPLGYAGYVADAVRPIYETSPTQNYQFFSYQQPERLQVLYARAKPITFFGFEQIGDTIVLLGESRFREAPLYDASHNPLTVVSVGIVSGKWTIRMSGNVGSNSVFNSTGAGLNGLNVANVVQVEDMTVADATLQAAIATNLNGLTHEVKAISGTDITLHTDGTPNTALTAVTDGEIHRVRYNRNNSYSTPLGRDPYDATYDNRPDDPDALTSWRVVEGLALGDTVKQCFPAWVANRQRDFGDSQVATDTEGIFLNDAGTRGVSRREQRQLPFRPNIETATDRLVLAAPGYGCMFQVPVKTPVDPASWLSGDATDAPGISVNANDVFDKPRALGVPKARLIDCSFTPAPPSPNIFDPGASSFNFNLAAFAGSPEFGLAPGTYLIAIAFEDEALGEEGLASEPIEITVPDNDYAYAPVLNFIPPAYVMPESLAFKMNVYIASVGETALKFYASFPLSQIPGTAVAANDTDSDLSAKYGLPPTSPDNPGALIRSLQVPLPGNGEAIADDLDGTRLAPQSASMPRGAEACKYIRGVLLAGGHTGNQGGSLQLWEARASSAFGSSDFNEPNEFFIRAHGSTAAVPGAAGSLDGDTENGTLGIAGRAFPDAYQGIEVNALPLLPSGSTHQIVDRVINRRADRLLSTGYAAAHFERLRVTRDIWDRTRTAGASPLSLTPDSGREGRYIWYEMQRGQLQVGDPGEPNRSSKAAIQFIDPNKGDDITAIGHLAGNAIICTRKETYSFAWYRAPGGEIPQLISNEFGCIGSNTMVEFDGGLAWISERGPVAIGGAGMQHVGRDVQEDFFGTFRRYQFDSRGMMRHAWSCHDAQRGLVMWGLVSTLHTATIPYQGEDRLFVTASDECKSRFPCDEVLIWSYRANAFSTWRPPSGLEVYWMRPLRLANGEVRVCFLAADGRIYALDEESGDTNYTSSTAGEFAPTASGTASTSVTLTFGGTPGTDGRATTGRDSGGFFLKAGMLVEVLNDVGEMVGETAISSVSAYTASTATLVLSAAQTWKTTYRFRVGARPRMTLLSTYMGAETMDNLTIQGVQMRYTLLGRGTANAKVDFLKTDLATTGPTAKTVAAVPAAKWIKLGSAENSIDPETRIGQRREVQQGGCEGPEVALKVVVTGSAQTRIADLMFEVP